MAIRFRGLIACGALFLALVGPDFALAASVSVTCSNTSTIQSKIDAAVAGISTDINVTGPCTENINVPAGKIINLIGAASNQGTTISPSNGANPTIYANGFLTLKNLTITSTTSTAFGLIQADFGAELTVVASIISSQMTNFTIVGLHNSNIWIKHSNISATGNSQTAAISAQLGTALDIQSDPNYTSGPNGLTTTVSAQYADAISCAMHSQVHLISKGSTTISVQNSSYGIRLNQCDLNIWNNNTSLLSNISIKNNTNRGVIAWNSTMQINNATVSGNGVGIALNMSTAAINSTAFTNNTTHVKSNFKSTIDFDSWNAPTLTTFSPVNNSSFACWQDGVIYMSSLGTSGISSYGDGSCVRVSSY